MENSTTFHYAVKDVVSTELAIMNTTFPNSYTGGRSAQARYDTLSANSKNASNNLRNEIITLINEHCGATSDSTEFLDYMNSNNLAVESVRELCETNTSELDERIDETEGRISELEDEFEERIAKLESDYESRLHAQQNRRATLLAVIVWVCFMAVLANNPTYMRMLGELPDLLRDYVQSLRLRLRA
jgi:hypothetical protein